MKAKFIPMLAGAIALTLAAVPFAVKAQSTDTSTPPATTQTQGHHHHRGLLGLAKKLNLSPDQISQIKTINKNAWTQIQTTVLTADQQAQLQAAKGSHQRPNLNLTDDQKAQIKTIRESAKTQSLAVLTQDQQTQLQQLKAQWQQQHSQNSQPSQ